MGKNYSIIIPKVEKARFAGLNRYVIPAQTMWAEAWNLYLLRPSLKFLPFKPPPIDSRLPAYPRWNDMGGWLYQGSGCFPKSLMLLQTFFNTLTKV